MSLFFIYDHHYFLFLFYTLFSWVHVCATIKYPKISSFHKDYDHLQMFIIHNKFVSYTRRANDMQFNFPSVAALFYSRFIKIRNSSLKW